MEPSNVGKTHPHGKLGEQDAFHVPVVLVTTDQTFIGSCHVRFTDNTYTKVEPCLRDDYHAVTDIWLDKINPGDKFYVMLRPGLVTKLRHEFDIDLVTPVPVAESSSDYDDYDGCKSCYEDYEYPEYPEDDGCRGCY